MSLSFKQIMEFVVSLVTIIGGLAATFKVIYEVKKSRQQRAKELRWRQANAAKELLDEVFSHNYSEKAVLMLDWRDGQREYEVKKDNFEVVSYGDVISVLKKNHLDILDIKEQYIRECFDFFLYFIDRIEHYIEIELIDFKDVELPLKPYAIKMNEDRQVYDSFMKTQSYELARRFLRRYQKLSKISNSASDETCFIKRCS